MSNLYETIKVQIDEMRANIKEKLADGRLGVFEMARLMREFMESINSILAELDVPDNKRLGVITEAVVKWWDEDLAPLDMPGPDTILDPAVRAALPGVVEILYAWIN